MHIKIESLRSNLVMVCLDIEASTGIPKQYNIKKNSFDVIIALTKTMA